MGERGVFGYCDDHGKTLNTEIDYLLKIKVIFYNRRVTFLVKGLFKGHGKTF